MCQFLQRTVEWLWVLEPVVVQCLSHVRLFHALDCSTPGFPVLHHLLQPAPTHVHWAGDAIQPAHPPSSPSLLTFNLPSIGVFSSESALHMRWPKCQGFSFSISPSSEYSGSISSRIDWFDLLAVQGIFKSLLQHHSLKASILWCSTFLMVQLSHLHMTTGKTIDLTRWTFVDKILSLLFNILSMLVTAFLPSSKYLLISCLQSQSTVILEPKKMKYVTISFFFFSHLFAWSDGTRWNESWVLSQLFHSPLSLSSRGSLVPLHFLPLEWYHLHIHIWEENCEKPKQCIKKQRQHFTSKGSCSQN